MAAWRSACVPKPHTHSTAAIGGFYDQDFVTSYAACLCTDVSAGSNVSWPGAASTRSPASCSAPSALRPKFRAAGAVIVSEPGLGSSGGASSAAVAGRLWSLPRAAPLTTGRVLPCALGGERACVGGLSRAHAPLPLPLPPAPAADARDSTYIVGRRTPRGRHHPKEQIPVLSKEDLSLRAHFGQPSRGQPWLD
eukprot:TRINITY_DN26868_c0_g2_i1.p1 TRINITY_DN26868_c0_g2~~TRINITY_DN26868_c0_g2_i1.p1  ORF type:complete len:194 (+),score=22.53 TRINITY_DN26868_c0_g2_i1:69-650(+)